MGHIELTAYSGDGANPVKEKESARAPRRKEQDTGVRLIPARRLNFVQSERYLDDVCFGRNCPSCCAVGSNPDICPPPVRSAWATELRKEGIITTPI